jgi:hypothetical protein
MNGLKQKGLRIEIFLIRRFKERLRTFYVGELNALEKASFLSPRQFPATDRANPLSLFRFKSISLSRSYMCSMDLLIQMNWPKLLTIKQFEFLIFIFHYLLLV